MNFKGKIKIFAGKIPCKRQNNVAAWETDEFIMPNLSEFGMPNSPVLLLLA